MGSQHRLASQFFVLGGRFSSKGKGHLSTLSVSVRAESTKWTKPGAQVCACVRTLWHNAWLGLRVVVFRLSETDGQMSCLLAPVKLFMCQLFVRKAAAGVSNHFLGTTSQNRWNSSSIDELTWHRLLGVVGSLVGCILVEFPWRFLQKKTS